MALRPLRPCHSLSSNKARAEFVCGMTTYLKGFLFLVNFLTISHQVLLLFTISNLALFGRRLMIGQPR